MRRCISLAKSAGSNVGLNPNVGAVLVHKDRIIGEGYYQRFGGRHAEVNAIDSVVNTLRHLILESTLYVSLEPCNIYGKTPPCSQLIIDEGIENVVVGCVDPNPRIAGSSLTHLQKNGVKITSRVLEQECKEVIAPFRVNILEQRPFITLKWAQSQDNFIGKRDKQIWLSNAYSKVWSHKLRTENDAILIGTTTALLDNPSLTSRDYEGPNPLRIIIDLKNKIPNTHTLLSDDERTLILNTHYRSGLKSMKEQWSGGIELSTLLSRLYEEKQVGRMIVEGGSQTIVNFVKEGLYDRAFVLRTNKNIEEGIRAPSLTGRLKNVLQLDTDLLQEIWK